MIKNKTSVIELFDEAKCKQTYLKVCAPMVRYSKVHFRTLVKNYGVDLCFTPMVLADAFCQNSKARVSEFQTTKNDSPLIVQFAAKNVDEFIDASKLVYPYADGVDLNCGCPQRWAMKDGYGSAMLLKPESIYELVKGVRNNLPRDFSVSVKLRILKEMKKTIQLCQQLEKCGVDFLTLHARTPDQKSSGSIDINALRDVCCSVNIPIIGNGGVKSLDDAEMLFETSACSGVMAASAMLTNPALFNGIKRTPLSCAKLWIQMKNQDPSKIVFQCYHHHLVFMLDKILTKPQKQVFNCLNTFESVDEYLNKNIFYHNEFDNCTQNFFLDKFITCNYSDEITLKYSTRCKNCDMNIFDCACKSYNCNETNGLFFASYVKEDDGSDYMDSKLFDEPT